jgi:hypothetical protein
MPTLFQTTGVRYIKISKTDVSGSDNSNSLRELQNIKIKYDTLGVIDHIVMNISEYPTYYLYEINPINITSSLNSVDNYALVVSQSFQTCANILLAEEEYKVILTQTILDSQAAFNTGSSLTNGLHSKYLFPNTPSIPLTITFQASASSFTTEPTFSIVTSQGGGGAAQGGGNLPYNNLITLASGTALPNGLVTVTYLATNDFFTGTNLFIRYESGDDFNLSDARLTVANSSSFSPGTYIRQVIIEPYLKTKFNNSDCDVLQNNVSDNYVDDFYMDVDYSTDSLAPVNYNQILSGSAKRAEVKSYYYNLLRHIKPRYKGSKNPDPGAAEFRYVLKTAEGLATERWSLYFYFKEDFPFRFTRGEVVEIYQQNNTLMGKGTIINVDNIASIGNSPSYIIVDIATTSTDILAYNFQFGLSKLSSLMTINYLYTGSSNFDESSAGTMYMIPNKFSNSNTFPMDSYNSNIYEFKGGKSTHPMIPAIAGQFEMGNILEVYDSKSVNILSPNNFEAYNYTIDEVFKENTLLNAKPIQYNTNTYVNNELKIISTKFGVPTFPDYIISSNFIPGFAALETLNTYDDLTWGNYTGRLRLATMRKGGIENGYIIATDETGSLKDLGKQVYDGINERGEKWFVTLAKNLNSPLTGSVNPWNYGYTSESVTYESLGVYPITSMSVTVNTPPTANFYYAFFDNPIRLSNGIDIYTSSGGNGIFGTISADNLGLMLWKGIPSNENETKHLIVRGSTLDGVGPGAIVLPNSSNDIIQNFNDITSTYGDKSLNK